MGPGTPLPAGEVQQAKLLCFMKQKHLLSAGETLALVSWPGSPRTSHPAMTSGSSSGWTPSQTSCVVATRTSTLPTSAQSSTGTGYCRSVQTDRLDNRQTASLHLFLNIVSNLVLFLHNPKYHNNILSSSTHEGLSRPVTCPQFINRAKVGIPLVEL